MTKKALIIGISNYRDRAPTLQAPIREIEEWRDLLVDVYDFPYANIRLLANERARKEEIETRFDWLFDGGEKEDQLVFIFIGHGSHLRQRNGRTGELLDNLEEALLAYPGDEEDFEKFAIYDDDLLERYARKKLPPGTDATFIFECCFGGGISLRDLPRSPVLMGVTPPADLDHRTRRDGWSERPRRELRAGDFAVPVFVSAAGELNLAVEIKVDGVHRSNFSFHAIRELRRNPAIEFDDLISTIRPLMAEYFPQFPSVQGNQFRRNNRFLQ